MFHCFSAPARSSNQKAARGAYAALRTLAIVSILLVHGCGWHLQGTTHLSQAVAVTYIDAEDRYTDFHRALRDSLTAAGVRLTDNQHDATAIVKVIKDTTGQRVLSVSARNTPEEYEVFYDVEYSVASQSAELIAPQKLELTRDYSFDEKAVLAKQREQSILRESLARDLASLIVRRMAAL
jgi:LPS-assembly lipoprotein